MRNMLTVLVDHLSTMADMVFFHLLIIGIFGTIAFELSPKHLRECCFLGQDIHTEYKVSYNMTIEGQKCSLTPPHNAPPSGPMVSGAAADVCVKLNVLYNFYNAGYENKSSGAIILDQISFGLKSKLLVIKEEGLFTIMSIFMNVCSFFVVLISLLVRRSTDKLCREHVRSGLLRQQMTGNRMSGGPRTSRFNG